jgi:tRNA(Ile)-lysidine synthase
MRPLTAGLYARPLLNLSRSEIHSYLQYRGLSFRVDGSNDDRSFLRNRIRHECLPYLSSYNPAITERLNATAELLAADEDVLETLTDQVFGRVASSTAETVILRLPALKDERTGLRMRLYRRAIREMQGDLAGITGSHMKQVDDLVSSDRVNGWVSLPGGLTARRCYDVLTLSPYEAAPPAEDWEIIISHAGLYTLPDGRTLSVRISQPPETWSAPLHRAYFNPRANPFPWTLRSFRPGDRFQPFGMTGTKKVKDFFIGEKISSTARRRVPLLFSGETLLWICGYRIAEAARISPEEREALEVEIPAITP